MWLWMAVLSGLGWGQDVEQSLTWSIRAGGSEIGHRDVTVKFVKTDAGVRRMCEADHAEPGDRTEHPWRRRHG